MKKLDSKELPMVDWKSFQPGPVVGVDEVGRGCLAGPVYAAAVSLKSDFLCDQLTDSKLMSEKRRNLLQPQIEEHHWVALGFATVEEIDEINIFQASLLAMKRAVENLEKKMQISTGHLLVDGSFKVPGLTCKQTTIVKGDLRCSPISAASIFAKVHRDQLMTQLGAQFPVYGFENTRAMQAQRTKKPSAKRDPVSITARASQGLKNFYHGQLCEKIVLAHYERQGFRCLRQRWKTPFGEIDLLLKSPQGLIYLVEVKSVSFFEFISHRLSLKQKKRLERVHLYCCEKWGRVVLELAVVSQQKEVLIIENVFG